MDGREIPGYYFDQEKGKYFKIENASTAPRADSQYSVENIKRRQREDRRRATESDLDRKLKLRLAKPTRTLTRAYVQRELTGDRHAALSAWPYASTTGYEEKTVFDSSKVRFFDLNPVSRDLYVAEAATTFRMPVLPIPPKELAYDYKFKYYRSIGNTLAHLTSEISSMHYLPASGALVTTTLGSDRAPVVYLTDPDHDDAYIGEQITPTAATTLWTSEPRPAFSTSKTSSILAADTELIAVGASRDLVLLTRTQQSAMWDSKIAKRFSSDVLALDWLDTNTIAIGLRDGCVHIYDVRSGGSSSVLSHPTPVTHLKLADDFTRIVCKGLQNTLYLYDMRYAKAGSQPEPPHPSKTNKKKRKHGHPKSLTTHSRPLLQFPYLNEDTTDLGLAIHSRIGLVAAADEDARIVLWSLKNGDVVRQFESKNNRQQRIRCMRFVEEGGGNGVSLWSVCNGGISRFGW